MNLSNGYQIPSPGFGTFKTPDGEEKFLEADTVIYATGQRPLWDEAKSLHDCAPEFYQIADCVAPKNMLQATSVAANIVRNIGRM